MGLLCDNDNLLEAGRCRAGGSNNLLTQHISNQLSKLVPQARGQSLDHITERRAGGIVLGTDGQGKRLASIGWGGARGGVV